MKNNFLPPFVLGLALLFSANSQAGLFTDDLSRCLISSTSTADKISLVKWMFTAAALHPAVGSIASVSKEQLDEANKSTAKLFERLM